MTRWGWLALAMALGAVAGGVETFAQARKLSPAPKAFHTTLTAAEMAHKQAVVETSAGTFVIALLHESAPNHVGYSLKLIQDGAYIGTTFHRLVKHGIVQGVIPCRKTRRRRRSTAPADWACSRRSSTPSR